MKFLVVAHKVMWEAVAFMAAPFVAATLVIMPHGQGNRWTFELKCRKERGKVTPTTEDQSCSRLPIVTSMHTEPDL
ncbi:hypothetical protein Patl1_34018 [Pistacia atlantica]|uniref:Uncharacterized protein n=1 Tax=Pistacia atlantica TaxID=434234 RepID=A0ACC0ZSU8_9ROSI|nr:hypothetical protein Patl1_34018 [Pistacia atlantica]